MNGVFLFLSFPFFSSFTASPCVLFSPQIEALISSAWAVVIFAVYVLRATHGPKGSSLGFNFQIPGYGVWMFFSPLPPFFFSKKPTKNIHITRWINRLCIIIFVGLHAHCITQHRPVRSGRQLPTASRQPPAARDAPTASPPSLYSILFYSILYVYAARREETWESSL